MSCEISLKEIELNKVVKQISFMEKQCNTLRKAQEAKSIEAANLNIKTKKLELDIEAKRKERNRLKNELWQLKEAAE